MAQDLKLLDQWVTKGEWPHVACPSCGDGSLAIEKFEDAETAASRNARDHEAWEPEWISGTFTGTLKCARSACAEPVVVAGDMKVDMRTAANGAWYGEYDEFYRLRFAWPALTLVETPAATPNEVTSAIMAASACLWVDPNSAANRLRFAIELLLTQQKVKRFAVTRNGKRARLTTHARITEFKISNQLAGEALEAVKWIGNSGSHDAELASADVIDGAEMLGYALRLIYDRTDANIQKRIRAVNRAKGLPKSRRP